jgi:hypothetical protein
VIKIAFNLRNKNTFEKFQTKNIVEHETELQARLLEHEERHRSQMQNLEQLLELTKQSLQSQQRSLNHATSYQTDYLYHQSE